MPVLLAGRVPLSTRVATEAAACSRCESAQTPLRVARGASILRRRALLRMVVNHFAEFPLRENVHSSVRKACRKTHGSAKIGCSTPAATGLFAILVFRVSRSVQNGTNPCALMPKAARSVIPGPDRDPAREHVCVCALARPGKKAAAWWWRGVRSAETATHWKECAD